MGGKSTGLTPTQTLPRQGLAGGDKHSFPPVRGKVGMGGRSTGPSPTRTLPRQGGGEVFDGDVHDIPPPVRGSGSKATRMKYLPLSARKQRGQGSKDEIEEREQGVLHTPQEKRIIESHSPRGD
jgi:hypothetical protein